MLGRGKKGQLEGGQLEKKYLTTREEGTGLKDECRDEQSEKKDFDPTNFVKGFVKGLVKEKPSAFDYFHEPRRVVHLLFCFSKKAILQSVFV